MPSATAKASADHLTADDKLYVVFHCPGGIPKLDPTRDHGQLGYVVRKGYVLLHSSARKTPLWVCERIGLPQLDGPLAGTRGRFRPDPKLLMFPRAENKDYRGSGYGGGQMAAPDNRTHDEDLRAATFFLSNVAPMNKEMKRGVWKALGDLQRKWVRARGLVLAVTGTIVSKEGSAGGRADGGYRFVGPGKVIIPTHFYKILVTTDTAGKSRAVGFVLENKKHSKPYDWKSYIKPIAWIEKRTGLVFFSELPDEESRRLKKSAGRMWGPWLLKQKPHPRYSFPDGGETIEGELVKPRKKSR